jgi:CPA2 family monovalent cation:H+ antiporter-2
MAHELALIPTIAIGLSLAFIGALIARRLGLPAIVGYMLAGIVIGPFTPGFVADQELAAELAEVGVILLMFGVGIHFSVKDLLAVASVAIPGAIAQIVVATALGTLVGLYLGWGLAGGVVFGLAISVASTVVLLRALEQRNEIEARHGRVAVGWLIVEDLFTVLVLILLPALAPLIVAGGAGLPESADPIASLALTVVKAGIFAIVMIFVAARVVPAVLRFAAREGSRELFTLSVLAVAIGIAYVSSALFGISLALGAFIAGIIVGESDVSHQAAADALPLRDAFAVLFFVSVGMLVDPAYLFANWPLVLAVVAIVIGAKGLAAYGIVVLLRQPDRVGLTVAAGLSQVGEFSFILATVALGLGILPAAALNLVVAAALVSITLNPFMFRLVEPAVARLATLRSRRPPRSSHPLAVLPEAMDEREPGGLRGHAIVAGYGRVARMLLGALDRRGFRSVVITDNRHDVDRLRASGRAALYGDAANVELLKAAGIERAQVLVVAMRDPHAVRLTTERAKGLNSRLPVIARSHSARLGDELVHVGERVRVVQGETEVAIQMTRYALRRFGLSMAEAEAVAQGLRGASSGG